MKTVTFFRCLQAGLLSVALLSGATYSHAASGTWIHAASGGLWSATGNWSGGTIADGSGSTADFSSIDITANNTVHMDAPHTLTSLIFDDTDPSTTAGWIVDSNSVAGNILTLAGSSPTITVNSMGSGATVTMGVIITNSNTGANSYWTKAGNGTLVLNSANTFTNGVKISAGTLKLGTTTARPGTGQMILSGGMFDLGSASGTVGIGSTYAALSITAAAPSGNTIQGGTLQAFSYAASLSSGNAIVTTALVGTGPAITKSGAGTLTLAGNNSFTGVANIQNGILSVATINRNASTSAPPQSATSNLGKPIDAAHGQINLGNSGNTGQLTDTGTGETSDRTLNLAGTSGGSCGWWCSSPPWRYGAPMRCRPTRPGPGDRC